MCHMEVRSEIWLGSTLNYQQAPVERGPSSLKVQQSLGRGIDAVPVAPCDRELSGQADFSQLASHGCHLARQCVDNLLPL